MTQVSTFQPTAIEKDTGAIYDHLFTAYSPVQFDDSVELFFKRHRRWAPEIGMDPELGWFRGKVCLDAGCGGGRFVVALSKLGASKVYGVDVSEQAIEAGRARCRERGLLNTEFIRASVLDLPFPDATFDYVVCSGVILLTPDPYRGFLELARVLKPGGKLFLSVYGKGGLKWFVNDIFRDSVCKLIPFKTMEKIWAAVGVPANKRYNMLDNLYTPYTKRFTEQEVRKWFEESGFERIYRVKFERYDYETLKSRIIHGEGWIQVYADKL